MKSFHSVLTEDPDAPVGTSEAKQVILNAMAFRCQDPVRFHTSADEEGRQRKHSGRILASIRAKLRVLSAYDFPRRLLAFGSYRFKAEASTNV
eukprot:scaffold7222_cov191-Pinguiococcus_pyrenoidosus.AAC.1